MFLTVILIALFQFSKIDTKNIQWAQLDTVWLILGAFILLPVNYYFEWLKWNDIVKSFKTDSDVNTNIQAFFAGIITGMLTPNMQGNFIGRLYYYPRKFRINIILLTLVANFGQFITTLILGLISAIIIGVPYINLTPFQLSLILLLFFLSFLFFLSYERWILKIFKGRLVQRMVQITLDNHGFRYRILFWSLCRNIVFSVQFLLVLSAFELRLFEIGSFLLIWQIYFWTTLAPSLFFGKIIIRESISVWVLGGIISNQIEIVFASLIVWLINLLLPTLIGIFICKKRHNE